MPGDPETKEYVTSLRVYNSRAITLTFSLEPWGEQYRLAPEETFEIVARGPEGDSLEVEFADDRITLYGWPGSVVTLLHKGTELGAGDSKHTPIPATPRGEAEKSQEAGS
jgi:hypothetical protein